MDLIRAVTGLHAPDGQPLAARVGIATGLVMVGELIGEAEAQERAVVGATPNLAARLQGLAGAGQVVIAESTARLTGGNFDLMSLGPHSLRGINGPVLAYRVEGERRVEGRFEAHTGDTLTPIVGRQHELGLLRERFERAQNGEGQVVLLSGEAGIGKSRLVRALREYLGEGTYTSLAHHGSPFHTNSTLHPVIGLLERNAGFATNDSGEDRFGKLVALLARGTEDLTEAVPLVTAVLGIDGGPKYPLPKTTPQKQMQRTFEVLIGQVAGLSTHRPVLALFEDAQWFDPTTLELLDLLVERVRALPVLVLIAFRPEFTPPWIGHAHVTQLSLSRLSQGQAAELAVLVAGGKILPAEVRDRILALTEGVPLFVEELTRTVLESGLVADRGDHYELTSALPPLAIPTTLRDSLMARLDRLAPVKEVAQTGAVIGREFSHDLLAVVAPIAEPELTSALEQLVAAGLVFRRGKPPDAVYKFKHALIQDAAYQSLLRGRRQQLHARLVQALEKERLETERDERGHTHDYGLFAYHCAEAGLVDKAVRYHRKAAALGIRRYAHMETVKNAKQGLELLASLPATSERHAEALELQAAIAEAVAALKGYGAESTAHAFRELRELCETAQDSFQRRNALWKLVGFFFTRHDWDGAWSTAEEILCLAQRQKDAVAEVMARRELGIISFVRGNNSAACDHLHQGIERYAKTRDTADFSSFWDPQISSMGYLSCALVALGYPERAMTQCRQAVAAARDSRWDSAIGAALSCWCRLCQAMGDWEAVDIAASEMLSLLDDAETVWRTRAEVFCIWALAAAGRTNRARERLGAFSHGARGPVYLPPYYFGLISQSHAFVGSPDVALKVVNEAIGMGLNIGDRESEAELHRLKGQWLRSSSTTESDEAEGLFRRAINVAQAQSAKLWELRATTSLARLWTEQGERQKACDLLAPVYGWFTEGFDTPDLKDAEALLGELT